MKPGPSRSGKHEKRFDLHVQVDVNPNMLRYNLFRFVAHAAPDKDIIPGQSTFSYAVTTTRRPRIEIVITSLP